MADRQPAGPVPQEALDYFRAKGLQPSFDYRDVWNEEHAHAYTVAKATSLDLLTMIRKETDRALAEGRTFQQFQADLRPQLQKAGWWGQKSMVDPVTGATVDAQLGSPRRLKIIYQTNLRTARAAGLWARAQRTKRALPFFVYELGPSEVHRTDHVALKGLTLPVDDPFWDTHFPPNGWGCKCWLRQVTKREADAKPPELRQRPEIQLVEYVNPRTGKTIQAPIDVDPNFAHNPGKERDRILAENLRRAEAAKLGITAKVSASITLNVTGIVKSAAEHALEQIDAVHTDGQLPKIPLRTDVAMNHAGVYAINKADLTAVEIRINGKGPWPELTVAHEIGHFLDHQVIDKAGFLASRHSALLAPFREALRKSRAYADIVDAMSSLDHKVRKNAEYLVTDHECFARAYAQYIAVRSGDQRMLGQVALARSRLSYRQWSEDDFREIAAALDQIFKQKGWL